MRFGYRQTTQTGQGKIAELFDMQPGKEQSDSQFRQQIISTVDFYKNVQQKEQKMEQSKIKVDLEIAKYKVISYDESLIQYMRKRGLKITQYPIGTEKLAKTLLKFTMENVPKTYIDTQGNVWELIY